MKGVARLALALVLTGCIASPLAAQGRPDAGSVAPGFELTSAGAEGTWTLGIDIPRGWALYAPDTGELGLPLTARWAGEGEGVPVLLSGPPGRKEVSAAGPVSVYRGQVRLRAQGRPGIDRTLEVRWALCREELCIPGTTRLTEGH